MPSYTNRAIVTGSNTVDGTPVVMTSEDMLTWAEVPSWPGATAAEVSVAGGAYFVATAAPFEADNYAYSFNGDDWTLDSAIPALQNVVWDGSSFLTLTANAAASYSAPAVDGPWSSDTTGTSGTFRDMAFGGGVVVAVKTPGYTNPALLSSSDGGATWTTHTPDTSPFGCYGVCYAAGRFVAVRPRTSSGSADCVVTSTDGVTWTVVGVGTNDLLFYKVAFGNGLFVAVGLTNAGATRTMTSADGLTWTVHTPSGLLTSGLSEACQVAFWAGLFGLVNPASGTIYTSADGQSWSGQAFTNRDWRGIDAGEAVLFRRHLGWKVGQL